MLNPISAEFISALHQRNVNHAMELAPWGICPEHNFPNLICVTLIAVEKLRLNEPERVTAPLLQLVRQNLARLHPFTCSKLAIRMVVAGVQECLTKEKLNKLVFNLHLYFPVSTFERIAPFVLTLLRDDPNPISTQTKIASIVAAYICEQKEKNGFYNQFLLQCFVQSTPDAPLPFERRLPVLKLLSVENSWIQEIALREIRRRASAGLWRQQLDGEVGRAILMADLRTVLQDKFPVFLKHNGEVLETTVERCYPNYPSDYLLQTQVHAETMDMLFQRDWEHLSAIVIATRGDTQQVFKVLVDLSHRISNDSDMEKILVVGAKDFKKALFSVLSRDLDYFLKRHNYRERSELEEILHRLDCEELLLPQDIALLTRIFSSGGTLTPEHCALYFTLLYSYLIRHHLPLEYLQQALALLRGSSCTDLVLFRDFPKLFPLLGSRDFTHAKDSHVKACLLWPELQIPLPTELPEFLDLALVGCKQIHHLAHFLTVMKFATMPENIPTLRERIPFLIESAYGFVQFERELFVKGEPWKKLCERYAEISLVSEALLQILISIVPEQPSEENSKRFARFIHKVYPQLFVRHDRFLGLLIELAVKAPWLVSEVKNEFKFPETAQCETWELEQHQDILNTLSHLDL